MDVQIIAFTEKGASLGSVLIQKLKELEITSQGYSKYEGEDLTLFTGTLEDFVSHAFASSRGIIFIGAIGIAVRGIAPFIASKDKDPAVVVVDELGQNVIPILSGHMGGANELAKKVADLIHGRAIITTATDLNRKFAVDVWAMQNDLVIENIERIKDISAAVLRGEKIGFQCDYEVDGDYPELFTQEEATVGIGILKGNHKEKFEKTLILRPKEYFLGVGCRKDVDEIEFERFLIETIQNTRIPVELIKGIATIDRKAEERAIGSFCKKYHCKLITYSDEELLAVEGNFTSSEFVKNTVGVGNVCERAAALASGSNILLLQKTTKNGITLAIGKEDWRCSFENYYGGN